MFEMNRHRCCNTHNGHRQAGCDQSGKQMRQALRGMGTCHDAAKLFPRPGAAIEFHVRRQLYDRETGLQLTTTGRIADLVLFGFADSIIDTQISFNIGHLSQP